MKKNFLILCFVALCGVLTAVELPKPDYHWCFEEIMEGKIMPAAGNQPCKILNGKDITFVEGRMGKAIQFSDKVLPGKSNIPCAYLAKFPLDFTKPFSVVTTLKLAPICKEKSPYRVFKDIWCNCGTRGPGARLSIYYGMLHFNTGDGANNYTCVDSVPANTPLPVDTWFQVAVVYDGKVVTLYYNGKVCASKKAVVTKPRNTTLYIGSHGGSYYNFPGALDDMKCFQRALTAGEVAAFYMDFAK